MENNLGYKPTEIMNKNPEQLVSNLDFGWLGDKNEFLVESINIPYQYLTPQQRANIPEYYANIVKPNIQDALRNNQDIGQVLQECKRYQEIYIPKVTSFIDYKTFIKQSYSEKINWQYQISQLLDSVSQNGFDKPSIDQALLLLFQAEIIESKFFAASLQMKPYAEHFLARIEANKFINTADLILIQSPVQPSAYMLKDIDIQLLASDALDTEETKKIQQKYFNNDPYYLAKAYSNNSLDKIEINKLKIEKNRIMQEAQKRWVDKTYLITERQMRGVADLDFLLMMDNCFDKYLENKLCFLHDIFLKISLMEEKFQGFKGFDKISKRRLKWLIKKSIFTPVSEIII